MESNNIITSNKKSKILIFGGSGYIGKHVVEASILYEHPTYVYTRPNSPHTQLLQHFQSSGVILVKGGLDEHEKLVSVIREVDIVISVLALPQVLDQLKIIEAIKVAGNVKRFIPSDFGCDEDKVFVLPPFQNVLDKKKAIRRAIEEAEIPYTFLAANLCASYFINYLLRPFEEGDKEITVFGDGKVPAALNYEEDIGKYTIKVANDPRACNLVVIYTQKINIISQLELISRWESKTGRTFKRVFLPENEIVTISESLPDPDNIPMALLHAVFVKGVTMNFEVKENDIAISTLYPDFKFTTIDELLDIFLRDPPKPASTPFA